MASKSALCGVCNFQKKSRESVIWCSDCDEGLCPDCEKHHGASKGTRHHITLPFSEYQQLPGKILKISQFCNKHNERYQTFCKKHDAPCCRKCIVESHNKCENLANIDDVTQNVKSSHAFIDMEDMLNNVAENLEKICKNRQENLSNLITQRHRIENEIKEARKRINNHLDKIQEKIMTEIKVAEEEETKNVENILRAIKKKIQEMNTFQCDIEKIKKHASDLQTFLAMKQMQSDIVITDEFIKSIVKIDQTMLICDISSKLTEFVGSIEKFGNISIQRDPCKIGIVRHQEKEAQIRIADVFPQSIDNLTLTLEKTLDTECRNPTGCTVLVDGRIVVSDYKIGKIQVLNRDGTIDFEMNTGFQTFDMAKTKDDNVIVVTSGDKNVITMIDINERKVIKSFNVERCNYGITVTDNKLLYCVQSQGIKQIELTNTTFTDIAACNLSVFSYIATFRDKIYYTNNVNSTVTCCDLQGKRNWEFKNESVLRKPRGIAVDNSGNMYVVGHGSQSVVVISPNGQRFRQLLSKKDGLVSPYALHYDQSTNELIVVNYESRKHFLFKVKYTG